MEGKSHPSRSRGNRGEAQTSPPAAGAKAPSPLDYVDHKLFLGDTFRFFKKHKGFYSHRYIAGKLGFKSSATFSRILKGDLPIDFETVQKLTVLFGLEAREKEYFETLVRFGQAETLAERKSHHDLLLAFKGSRAEVLSREQLEYFREWHHVALRELLNFTPYTGNAAALGALLEPPVPAEAVSAALQSLLRLGLLRKTAGGYKPASPTVKTEEKVQDVTVYAFQMAMLDLAKRAVTAIPREKRSISTLTLSVSGKTFDAILDKVERLRNEILHLAENDPFPVDRLYQMNFQIFPLTRPETPAGPVRKEAR